MKKIVMAVFCVELLVLSLATNIFADMTPGDVIGVFDMIAIDRRPSQNNASYNSTITIFPNLTGNVKWASGSVYLFKGRIEKNSFIGSYFTGGEDWLWIHLDGKKLEGEYKQSIYYGDLLHFNRRNFEFNRLTEKQLAEFQLPKVTMQKTKDPELAKFMGRWGGIWDVSKVPHVIIVNNGEHVAYYSKPEGQVRSMELSCRFEKDSDGITFLQVEFQQRNKSVKVKYWLYNSDTLFGFGEDSDGFSQGGFFTKIP